MRSTELWTPVLLDNGIFKDSYIVSNLGRVKKKRLYKDGNYQFIIVKVIDGKRPVVRMYGNGREFRKSIARLVLSSFNYRVGCEFENITYLDGNMKNCKLSNLKYATDKTVPDAVVHTDPKTIIIRSCSTCAKYKCMTGMETLSSDFGACGCVDYKPRETENN